jgi:hypothetical protein
MAELEHYQFISTIAPLNSASMATIFEAKDTRDASSCAIKQICKNKVSTENMRESFVSLTECGIVVRDEPGQTRQDTGASLQ